MFSRPKAEVECCRVKQGVAASTHENGNDGCFLLPGLRRARGEKREELIVFSEVGRGWEHVSVSVLRKPRHPTWEEMYYVRDMFWPRDEPVLQFYTTKSDSLSLHLWRAMDQELRLPDPLLPGEKENEGVGGSTTNNVGGQHG